ncbi:3 -5 exonuclease [Botrytis cinerea]
MSTTWYVVFNEEFDENFGMGLDDESEQHSTSNFMIPIKNLSDDDNETIESFSSDCMPNLLSTSEEWLHYYTPGSSDEDEIEEEWETGVDLWVCSQDEHDQWGQQSGPLIDWDLENSTEPVVKEPLFKTTMIDTPTTFNEFLPVLSQLLEDVPELAFLSRRETFIIDVSALLKLGIQVFKQENAEGLSLKKVLESKKYLQLWFDVRQDWDTLYHLFEVTPGRILDIQLLEFLSRRGSKRGILGLSRTMQYHGKAFMSSEELDVWLDDKEEGRQYFRGHKLGYAVLEEERPISETTKSYIAGDTDCMFQLYFCLRRKLRDWDNEMEIDIPEKATEPLEDTTELSTIEQPIEAPVVLDSGLSTIKSQDITEPAAPVEPHRRRDWLAFVEEQSLLRAELAMAPEYDPDDEELKYHPTKALLEISRQQSDHGRAIARRDRNIERGWLALW